MKTLASRFWKFVAKGNDCWLWMGSTAVNGYGKIGVREGDRRRPMQAHRAAWLITMGPIPDGVCVLHKCDVRSCVNPSHLFLGTQLENVRDMISKGRHLVPRRLSRGDEHYSRREPWRLARGEQSGARRHPETRLRGESHPQAKLIREQVREIFVATGGYREIAERYKVDRTLVGHIKNRRVWADVTADMVSVLPQRGRRRLERDEADGAQ